MKLHHLHVLAACVLLASAAASSLTGGCAQSEDPQEDPGGGGQGPNCLSVNASCDSALDCCTGSCLSGTCVDLCSPNPCKNDGVCAVSDSSSYTCTCASGYKGAHCETPPPPPGPAIGCHDSPGTAGNTGIDDLYYLGPIDTVNNIRFHRAPRDGTCSGSSYQNGTMLIEAADAAAAGAKCQAQGMVAASASLWDGLAAYWICEFPPFPIGTTQPRG